MAGTAGAFVTIPLFALGSTTGPNGVGTSVARLGGVPVQVWYPARRRGGARRAPYYLERGHRPLRARVAGAIVRTAAFVDAPYQAGRFPVLLYSAAWGGTREDNTAYAQDLASHGFVVVAMDDFRPAAALDFASAQASSRSIEWATCKVRLQASVASSIIDGLDALRQAGTRGLAEHIDLTRIGMYGYSFGGAVAAQAAVSDARIRAAANIDGWMFGDPIVCGVDKPFIMISGDAPGSTASAPEVDPSADPRAFYTAAFDRANDEAIVSALRRNGGYWLTIDGTRHGDYADAALLPRLRAGAVDRRRSRKAFRIAAGCLLRFFDHFLNGRPRADFAAPGVVAARLDRWECAPRLARPAAIVDAPAL